MRKTVQARSILVLHGPNLNLLGLREPEVYGRISLAEIDERIAGWARALGLAVEVAQHNGEGALIDALHSAIGRHAGVVFNPGGYTHTSVVLRDAIAALAAAGIPTVEVHLSNIFAREARRRQTVTGEACLGVIAGFGAASYGLALRALAAWLENREREAGKGQGEPR